MWRIALAVVALPFWFLARAIKYLLMPFVWLFALLVAVLAVLILIVPTTPRDVAYRNIDPASEVCGFSPAQAWDVLADPAGKSDMPVDNDEVKAIEKFPSGGWERKFSCSLQRHTIPAAAGGDPLFYNLAFVEFREDGSPYELIKDLGQPYSLDELSSRVRFVNRDKREPITQLRAVTNLLRQTPGRNYVVVFIHGWRHDARVGDDNVAALRTYAAHAARFLKERCHAGEQEQCDRVVTAVFIGWRGARIDERRIVDPLAAIGNWLDGGPEKCRANKLKPANGTPSDRKCWRDMMAGWGNGAASLTAALTLYDRKPVSEAIAPHVLTAIRSIESTFDVVGNGHVTHYYDKLRNPNRLLVIGHSLGGNLLATALEHDAVKRVEWQAQRNAEARLQTKMAANGADAAARAKQQNYFDPPLGNLVVLINPASEAHKWTSIQRAVWQHTIVREGDAKSDEDYGHDFFPDHQRPVVVAVTSAFAWPPGGIRTEDCAVAFNFDQPFKDDPPVTDGADRQRRKEA